MTIPKIPMVTVSNRGESKAQMELNDAFRLVEPDAKWMQEAKCHSDTTIKWFPDQGERHLTSLAKKYCIDCPVRSECLNYAIKNQISHGVWGGQSAYERRLMAFRRK